MREMLPECLAMVQQNSSSPDKLNGEQAFPRLSINHLLLLVLTVSVVLAYSAPEFKDILQREPQEFASGRKSQALASTVTDSVASGIALFGFIVVVHAWLRGPRLTWAPGHWVFGIQGLLGLYNLISNPMFAFAYSVWGQGHFRGLNAAMNGIEAVMHIIAAMICTRAFGLVIGVRWKVCLAILWTWLACMTVLQISKVSQHLWSTPGWYNQHLFALWGSLWFAFTISFIVAAMIDVASRVRRDWLHYLAILMAVLFCLSSSLSLGPFLSRWWQSAISRFWD